MSYRDIQPFDNRNAQKDYFDSLDGKVVKSAQGHKFRQPIRLEIPFNEASQYNYVVVYNDYPDLEHPRYWYYFIQSVNFINMNVSEFIVMLDVWQSFQFDITLGNCYVERGHVGIANSKQFDDYGRSYLSLPEGLDTGAEMTVSNQIFDAILTPDSHTNNEPTFGVMIVCTIDVTADPGTEDNPHLATATGSTFEHLPNGPMFLYIDNVADYIKFMKGISKFSWVSQGISNIYMVPNINNNIKGDSVELFGVMVRLADSDWTNRLSRTQGTSNFRNYFKIPDRYKNLKKFLTYPYSAVELTCLNGQSLIAKPELMNSKDFYVDQMNELSQPGARIKFIPEHYNNNGAANIEPFGEHNVGATILGGEFTDFSVGIDNVPQFAAVNNTATALIAGSAHSLTWSKESAKWDQNKTMKGVNNAYAQANMSVEYANQQTSLSNRQRSANTAINNRSAINNTAIQQAQANFDYGQQVISDSVQGVSDALGSGASGAAEGGAAGAAVGVVGSALKTGVSFYQHNAQYNQANLTRALTLGVGMDTANNLTSQANGYANVAQGISNNQAHDFADMNRSLGTAVSSGDYANTIAGINAKIQDMADTQPSQIGNMGGDAFNVSNGIMGLLIRFRQIQPYAMKMIGEFWLRYGYYVQQFMIPPKNLNVMSKFTYWKMHELYIQSSTCPEEFRMTIKGIFEKGVTVWAKPEYIGVTDYGDNQPLSGVSY